VHEQLTQHRCFCRMGVAAVMALCNSSIHVGLSCPPWQS
jgi:hypothetical protein